MLRFLATFLLAPALIAQAAAHPDQPRIQHAISVLGELVGQWDRNAELQVPYERIGVLLEAWLGETHGAEKNPLDPSLPAFAPTISRLECPHNWASVKEAMEPLAVHPGQMVTGLLLPTRTEPGFLVAVYRPRTPLDGNAVVFKAIAIE